MENLTERKGLNANILKYIAVVAMLIDHIGWAFVPFNSLAGQLMHLVGRFTAPIMCYFVAEGYFYTKNLKRYILRLAAFAVLSHFPFVMAECMTDVPVKTNGGELWINPQLFTMSTGVIYTLLLGLLALHTWKSLDNKALKIFTVICICILSCFGDWMFFSVLWILLFGIYRGNLKKQLISYYIVTAVELAFITAPRILSGRFSLFIMLWQLGLLIAPIFFILYNGKRGNSHPFNKWFFYIFYPVHLLIIGIIKLYF